MLSSAYNLSKNLDAFFSNSLLHTHITFTILSDRILKIAQQKNLVKKIKYVHQKQEKLSQLQVGYMKKPISPHGSKLKKNPKLSCINILLMLLKVSPLPKASQNNKTCN